VVYLEKHPMEGSKGRKGLESGVFEILRFGLVTDDTFVNSSLDTSRQYQAVRWVDKAMPAFAVDS